MGKLTIRAKITLWFIMILVLIVGLTYAVFFYVADSVNQNTEQSDLVDVVDWDAETIRWHPSMEDFGKVRQGEYHVECGDGYLIIGDDFVNLLNGVGVGIYRTDGENLFGSDLIPDVSEMTAFREGTLQTVDSGQDTFYVYDRELKKKGLEEELWLRGSVDREQKQVEYSRTLQICLILLPLLILLAAAGAYVIARRSLQPLTRIAQTARSISSGSDLQRRITTGREDDGVFGGDEAQQLATSFNEMMQRLEASFAAEKQFTSDVSHELRTPMSVILAQCELALEEEDLTEEEARNALRLIRRQGDRMNDLIEDMLTYTRIDRHHEKYPFADVDLSALTEEVCEEFTWARQQEKEGKDPPGKIRLETEIEGGIHMEGSDLLLRRLLSNLISNGFRYGRDGGRVRVSLRRIEGGTPGAAGILLSVEDDGIGIAPEDLPRIFDRFYQADPARTGEGTGLGLSMVREIVSIHRGEVRVDSSPGRGSTFTVVF